MTPLANIRAIRDYADKSKLRPDHRGRNRLIAVAVVIGIAVVVGWLL